MESIGGWFGVMHYAENIDPHYKILFQLQAFAVVLPLRVCKQHQVMWACLHD